MEDSSIYLCPNIQSPQIKASGQSRIPSLTKEATRISWGNSSASKMMEQLWLNSTSEEQAVMFQCKVNTLS